MKRSIVPAATRARAHWLFALGFGLVGAILALAASLAATPQYEAHARLYVSTVGGAPISNASYQESNASQQIALSLSKLVSSEVVTDRVVQSLQLDISASDLASKIEATVEPETVLIDLSVTESSPTAAREIANATAFEFTDFVDELQVKATPSTPRPQVTLVQPAVTPSVPISPNVARNVGLGTLAGLAVGLAFANLRERANRTVRDVHTLERIIGQPPLGSIPISRSRNGRSVAIATDESVSEGFKEVRTNLQHALGLRPTRIVCVTSAGLREGKTTTVLGIAIALADAGHRVVVVDSDLRRPDLSSRLKLTGTDGLTEVLSGRSAVGDVIHPSGLAGIDAISSGHASHQPSELLSSDKAALLFCLLGERYDFVLLDTPALLAFTDAAVVADHTDGVVLVAPYAHVESNDLQSAVACLQRVEARILGPVFTFAPVSESRMRSLKARRGKMKSGERHPGWLRAAEDVEDDGEQNGGDGSRGDGRLEDDLEPLREHVIEVEYRDQDPHAEPDVDDDQVHGAEQRQSGTTQHGPWHHGDERAKYWEQAQEDQDAPSNGYHAPALDAGYRNQPDVLGEWVNQAEGIHSGQGEGILVGQVEETAVDQVEDSAVDQVEDPPVGARLKRPRWIRLKTARWARLKTPAVVQVEDAAVDQVEDAAVDQVEDAAVDQVEDAAVDQVEDAAVDQVEDAAVDQVEDAAVGQVEDAAVGQVEDAAVDQVEDAAVDQVEDAAVDQVEDAAVGQVEDAAVDQVEDAAVDQVEDAAVDQVEDAAVDQVEDAAVDQVEDAAVDQVEDAAVDQVEDAAVDQVEDAAVDQVEDTAVDQVEDTAVDQVEDTAVDQVEDTAVDQVEDTAVDQVEDTAVDQVEDTAVDQVEDTAVDQVEDTAVDQVEDTAVDQVEDTAVDQVEDTAVDQVEDTAVDQVEDTAVDQVEDTAVDQVEDTAVDQVEDTAVGQVEDTAVGQVEDPVGQAEEESQVNHAGVEQRHERETRTLTENTAEPDFDAGWSHESELDNDLWPLLEHMRELATDGAPDNHT